MINQQKAAMKKNIRLTFVLRTERKEPLPVLNIAPVKFVLVDNFLQFRLVWKEESQVGCQNTMLDVG
jgi:hypothetical protein